MTDSMKEQLYKTYRKKSIARLERAGKEDARLEFDWLAEELAGITKLRAIQDDSLEISSEAISKIDACLEQRIAGRPIQYILGKAYFSGFAFTVRPGVLIPRQDTEILVSEAIGRIGAKKAALLDLCTGSGCIGLSVLKCCPNTTAVLSDISEDALSVCKTNAEALDLSDRCQIVKSDLWNALQSKKFDYIFSNPPYIKTAAMNTLSVEVRENEPALALCGGEDGLDFYRRIAAEAPAHLNPDGILFLEIGYDLAEEVRSLLKKDFAETKLLSDYGNQPRVVVAALSSSKTV